MADEKEPKAITYKQVQTAVGKDGSLDTWYKIGRITGAGEVPVNAYGEASIDLTNASDSEIERIDALLGKAEDKKDAAKDEAANTKTRGNK